MMGKTMGKQGNGTEKTVKVACSCIEVKRLNVINDIKLLIEQGYDAPQFGKVYKNQSL